MLVSRRQQGGTDSRAVSCKNRKGKDKVTTHAGIFKQLLYLIRDTQENVLIMNFFKLPQKLDVIKASKISKIQKHIEIQGAVLSSK